MKTYLISTIFLVISTPCYAQYNEYMYGDGPSGGTAFDYASDEPALPDGSTATHFTDGGSASYVSKRDMRPRYVRSDRLSKEEYETQVFKEQARRRHIDNTVGRDDAYTDMYESNIRWQERRNVLSSINEASSTMRDIANTIKYLQNLF